MLQPHIIQRFKKQSLIAKNVRFYAELSIHLNQAKDLKKEMLKNAKVFKKIVKLQR